MKTLLEDILKPGAKLTAKVLDYSDPKLKKELEELSKRRNEILESKNVDWARLERTYITI